MGLRDGSNAGPTGQHPPATGWTSCPHPRRWQVPVERPCARRQAAQLGRSAQSQRHAICEPCGPLRLQPRGWTG